MGYGAMQLAGPEVWGPPRDVDAAIAVLREAVDSGVNHIEAARVLRERVVAGMIVVIMGVAGSGKSTVGQLLASELHCQFLDGDTLHPPGNIEKMTHGIPLTDGDRAPWLAAIHGRIANAFQRAEALVVACSALKQRYRDSLSRGVAITWVYLKGNPEVIRERLKHREHHFMKAQMVASQFADLEEPTNAIVIDVAVEPSMAVKQIVTALSAGTHG